MAIQTAMGRLRTVEFFGVLLPGLFVVGSFGYSWFSARAPNTQALGDRVGRHFTSDPQWYPVFVAIFAAYIIGNVIRAFPVSMIDDLIGRLTRPVVRARWFRRFASERLLLLYGDPFPYRRMLEYVRNELKRSGTLDESQMNLGPAVSPDSAGDVDYHAAFDFWKTYVTMRSPEFTVRLHELEARTRMFYGMLWATMCGVIISLVATHFSHTRLPLWWTWLSLFGFLVFHLRRTQRLTGNSGAGVVSACRSGLRR